MDRRPNPRKDQSMSRWNLLAWFLPVATLLLSSISCRGAKDGVEPIRGAKGGVEPIREARDVVEPIRLFNGKDLSGWSILIDPSAVGSRPATDPLEIFKVEDGLIHVSGE